jgi:hypothetical protein
MIKFRTNPARLFSILITAIWLALSGATGDDSFIGYLKSKFEKYNNNYGIERTYLMTDRFVYRPGEDLWFKGYVVSGKTEINSEDFFVRLISDRGDEIIYRRYPVSGNGTSGRLVIPRSCIPGKYWLIAYTGWMKNRCPNEAFRKEILISKYFERRFQVETIFDKLSYKSGDTLIANIRIIDPAGRPVSGTAYDYFVETFRKTDIRGNGSTDIKGKSKLTFVVPQEEELMMLTIGIKSRRLSGDFSTIIPFVNEEVTIKFYPEGGSMVSGIPGIVGLVATDKFGIPKVVTGILTDGNGQEIGSTGTSANGKGKIEINPGHDSLFFNVDGPEGTIRKFPLPMAKSDGIAIRFNGQYADTAQFLIRSTDNRRKVTYWIGVLNSKIVWTNTENFTLEKSVKIPTSGHPSGIMQVTVFDQDYNIVAERLIRIRNLKDELRIQMERDHFRNRQRVSLLVEFPEKLIESDLALSVSIGNLAHHDQDPSFHDVFISNPCSDIRNYSPIKDDLDLLTTEFYPVDWKEILTYGGSESPYKAQDGLNGFVYDKKENIAPHAKVRITHFPNFRFYETQTDETGSFRVFFGSDIIDYKYLNIDAYDALGKTNLSPRVDYTYIKELQKIILDAGQDSKKEKAVDLSKYGEPDLVYDLRYGPGKFRKTRTDTRKKYDPYQYANYTDIMDIIQDIEPYRLQDNKIIFLNRNRIDSASMAEAIIVVNGALKGTNTGALINIIPSDITNINISNASLDIKKYTPLKFSSVIEITTIQGMYRYSQAHLQTGQGIFNSDREFYSPDYAVESSYSADNRKTLYWNPKIPLYQGKSMVVTFYTSDIKGTFFGQLTGLDKEGNPIERSFKFRVE